MSKKSRKTIIAGNWKMHKTIADSRELAKATAESIAGKRGLPTVVLCPPFTSLSEVSAAVHGTHIEVGAQNMEHHEWGAYTGEISPAMILDAGAKYVIIGHSERRQYYGETNSIVNLKLKAALHHKLIPIVCVGESLDEREEGLTDSVVRRQIGAALAEISAEHIAPLVVAYEPLWAIGTGKTCESKEANRVAAMIRQTISEFFHEQGHDEKIGDDTPILYGGSVKPSTAEEQMQQPDIDGALVGGASLHVSDFLAIIEAGAKRVHLAATK